MRLCRLAGLKYRVRLTFSDQILVPVALEGGEICIPERALTGLSPAQQESMLAHELAHIVRRDADWRFAAQLMQAIFFFQPLNYIANRKLQELAEYLCDDWAVQHTRNQLSLAQCLSEVATWVQQQAHPINLPTLTGKPSLLLNRVTRLVGKPEERHSPISEYWHIAIGISIVIIAIALAPTVSVPEAAPVPLLRQEYGNSFFYLRNGDGASYNFVQALPVPPPIPLPPEHSAAGS